MWYSLIINAIFSILIIFLVHHLWEYCKIHYTSPKMKNVLEFQESKYKQIVEDMKPTTTPTLHPLTVSGTEPSLVKLQSSDFLPSEEKEWIHNELTAFIGTL